MLETKALTKSYALGSVEIAALKGVDLAVQPGEFVAIMGPSGSGKSTLLHLLGGLDWPTSGQVLLGGTQLGGLSDDDLTLLRRRRIGFIFQQYNLVPTLTAAENVALPLVIDGKNPRQHAERIDQLLTLVGLGERRDHRPDQLSGGQQQRVAIARAFVHEPQLVLADEPTGNLDSRSGGAILELLRRTCAEISGTVVMVTHDPRAASYADRVIFLKDGLIVRELPGGGGVPPIVAVMAELEL